MRDVEKTIGSIADKQKIAYLSAVDEDGFPETKAMLAPRKREGISTFWLTTNTSSLKVTKYRNNPKACLYFSDTRFYRGVMLKGMVEILEDVQSKEMLWQNGDTLYYSKGVTDPDYCVLKFTAQTGRYYSNFKTEEFIV